MKNKTLLNIGYWIFTAILFIGLGLSYYYHDNEISRTTEIFALILIVSVIYTVLNRMKLIDYNDGA